MSTNPEARAWIRVRADALRRNFSRIRDSVASGARIVPMIKADAYGLGMAKTIEALATEGAWGWGVSTLDEGLAARRLRPRDPIIVLSPLPDDALAPALDAELELTVSSVESLDRLVGISREAGAVPRIHVDVDTGMGRTGFDSREASRWLPAVMGAARGDVEWVGCFTHLHSADEGDETVRDQWDRLQKVLEMVEEVPPGLLVHVLNSAGCFRTPEYAAAVVRPGIFLFGGRIGPGQPVPERVASLHARIVHVKEAPEGSTLGYGATYRARRVERWATLSVGYGDGLPRALGNRGHALVAGARVPIIGRISMDLTVVDISDVPGVQAGDAATLIGAAGGEEITIDDVAEQAGTISYEVLTGLTGRLPRIWTGLDGS